jgi:hypothetical protein
MSSKAATPNARLRSEASHLIIEQPDTITKSKIIGEIEVRAQEQPHMSLGDYTAAHPPKGFSIHVHPEPEPDTIVTQVTRLGSDEEYELVLHIANYGSNTVSAQIRAVD